MKRLAILLAAILALSIFASAAETTTAEVPVTLTVIESQRQISVTVPAALPISVVDGKVLTASQRRHPQPRERPGGRYSHLGESPALTTSAALTTSPAWPVPLP